MNKVFYSIYKKIVFNTIKTPLLTGGLIVKILAIIMLCCTQQTEASQQGLFVGSSSLDALRDKTKIESISEVKEESMNISASIFTGLDNLTEAYCKKAYKVLAPECSKIFLTGFGLWILWNLILFRGLVPGVFNINTFLERMVIFSFIQFYLHNSEEFFNGFIMLKETVFNYAQILVNCSSADQLKTITTKGPAGLLQACDEGISSIFRMMSVVRASAGWLDFGTFFGCLLLSIPFFLISLVFLFFLLDGIFGFMIVATISPLLIIAAGFSSTRGIAGAGVRQILNASLTIIFASITMGFTISLINQCAGFIPVNKEAVEGGFSNWILINPSYWKLLSVSCVSVFFHFKAARLASALSGYSDSSSSSTGVISATRMAAQKVISGGSRK